VSVRTLYGEKPRGDWGGGESDWPVSGCNTKEKRRREKKKKKEKTAKPMSEPDQR